MNFVRSLELDTVRPKGVALRARNRARPRVMPNAAGNYALLYEGGPVIACATVYPVFIGRRWEEDETYVSLAAAIQLFLNDYFSSSAVAVLRQYGFVAGGMVSAHFEGATPLLDDMSLADLVAALHAERIVPDDAPDQGVSQAAHLALAFFDDAQGFADTWAGHFDRGFYGYHEVNAGLRAAAFHYGAIAPMDDACVAEDAPMAAVCQLDRICRVVTHVLAEWITDPIPGASWYSGGWGEIGDIAEGQYDHFQVAHADGTVQRWAMQKIYSLADDMAGAAPCVATTTAPYAPPADHAGVLCHGAASRPPPAAYHDRGLLPLPATHRVGNKRSRRPTDVLRYAQRLLGDLPHPHLHPQLPSLLREMADTLERSARVRRR